MIEEVSSSIFYQRQREVLLILGKNIRKKRSDLGLTQIQLAEKMFADQHTISDLENKSSLSPGLSTLLKLSIVFDCTIGDLFTDAT